MQRSCSKEHEMKASGQQFAYFLAKKACAALKNLLSICILANMARHIVCMTLKCSPISNNAAVQRGRQSYKGIAA